MLPVRAPERLPRNDAAAQGYRSVNDERPAHHERKPYGPCACGPAPNAERPGAETERDRACVTEEDACGTYVEQQKAERCAADCGRPDREAHKTRLGRDCGIN